VKKCHVQLSLVGYIESPVPFITVCGPKYTWLY